MATSPQLREWRDKLSEARFSGVRSVTDQNGEQIVYRSDAEIARAIAAVDSEIAALHGRRLNLVKFQTSKGL